MFWKDPHLQTPTIWHSSSSNSQNVALQFNLHHSHDTQIQWTNNIFEYTEKMLQQSAKQKLWLLLADGIPVNSLAATVNGIFEILRLLQKCSVDVFTPSAPGLKLHALTGHTRNHQPSSSPYLIFSTTIGAVLPNSQA